MQQSRNHFIAFGRVDIALQIVALSQSATMMLLMSPPNRYSLKPQVRQPPRDSFFRPYSSLHNSSTQAWAAPSFANDFLLFGIDPVLILRFRSLNMARNDRFRSHAFCRPRFLDGQGDEITGKEPAWKGTVASRVRSLNDMNSAASTSQAPARPVSQAREEATRSKHQVHGPNRTSAQRQTDESHERGEVPERANPFVRRRSPTKVPSVQSRPSVPERVSHSSVPVRAPIPSVLVQRPTFFADQTQPTRPSTTRDFANPEQETDSRQGFGRRPTGDNLRGAGSTSPSISAGRNAVQSLGPSHTQNTLRRFEGLESKKDGTTSGFARDARDSSVAVGPRPRTQLQATGPWAIGLRKSQPELRTKEHPARDMPEASSDARHGLTVQKASSPDSVRPTSPSVGIGPRNTTFGRAGRGPKKSRSLERN